MGGNGRNRALRVIRASGGNGICREEKASKLVGGGKAYRQGGRATLGHGLPEDTSRMLWMFAVTDISINFHDALDATL